MQKRTAGCSRTAQKAWAARARARSLLSDLGLGKRLGGTRKGGWGAIAGRLLEIGALVAFVVMTGITWFAVSDRAGKGQMLPTDLTATLLIGTLVPAMAILVLLGRRIALRRRVLDANAERDGKHQSGTARR